MGGLFYLSHAEEVYPKGLLNLGAFVNITVYPEHQDGPQGKWDRMKLYILFDFVTPK